MPRPVGTCDEQRVHAGPGIRALTDPLRCAASGSRALHTGESDGGRPADGVAPAAGVPAPAIAAFSIAPGGSLAAGDLLSQILLRGRMDGPARFPYPPAKMGWGMGAESGDLRSGSMAVPGRGSGILPVLVAGLIAGLDGIGFAVAVASLLFTGALASGLSMGAGAALLCTIILSALAGWRGSLPTMISHVQDMGVAVLAVTLGGTAAVMAAAPEQRVATAFVIIALSSFAAGALMWLTGKLRAGQIVKFFPLEVLAGFMAGTGWLLLTGGIAMTGGVEPGTSLWLAFADQGHLKLILPGLAFGGLLYWAMARYGHPLTLLGLLLGGIALFYAWLFITGGSVADAAAQGFLPRVDTDAALALPFPAMLWQADWSVVAQGLPGILTAALLCLFAALMNTSALEIASGREADMDRDMKLTGGGNLLVACVGGPPGYPGLAISVLAQKLGVTRRGVGLVTAAVVLAGFLFSRQIVAHVPLFVNAGLIFYFGIDLLKDWLIDTRRKFSLREWSVVVVIVLVVAVSGFLQAIAAGFLVATVLFAWSYAHVPVIRSTATLATLPSSIERAPEDSAFIAAHGGRVKIIQLQGFLFFGTAEKLMAPLREALAQGSGGTQAVVLDFSHVTSLDTASAGAVARLAATAGQASLDLYFCGLKPHVLQVLERSGLASAEGKTAHHFDTLDQTLEHIERQLLAGRDQPPQPLSALMLRHGTVAGLEAFGSLIRLMHTETVAPGQAIIRAGDRADRLFFLERGRAQVLVPRPGGGRRRLRTMEAGALLGDVAFALDVPRTADVVAEDECQILWITVEDMRKLEATRPELGMALQRILSRALAEKVVAANRLTDHMRS
ncbi:SLC26A/SulP transporter family protein [Aestuariivirga sp.]|uniref:SLC26A/SulP transporter family protein n=1 Tax=Aestuariivirga sp. TaxID=2650926 RepID=UPI003BAD9DFC